MYKSTGCFSADTKYFRAILFSPFFRLSSNLLKSVVRLSPLNGVAEGRSKYPLLFELSYASSVATGFELTKSSHFPPLEIARGTFASRAASIVKYTKNMQFEKYRGLHICKSKLCPNLKSSFFQTYSPSKAVLRFTGF